ncbi:MAG: AraC family transcriptional regulator [Humidesulfovibrio sp.]|nr:AraC family transcriptional regulator [Humidesulfovibrio sp.]
MAGTPLHADVRFWRDPALPGVEARSSTYTKSTFRTHTHQACIVSLVEAGRTCFTLGAGRLERRHTAQAGQIVVIEAETPHACNPEAGNIFSYRLLALAPGWLAGTARAARPAGATGMPPGPPPRFHRPVLDDPELFAAWRDLHEAFVWGAPVREKQALLMACLRELVTRHATPTLPRLDAQNPAVALARQAIAASPGVWLPLEELAGQVGLSRHHFLRVFKSATGLPPHAYQLQQAIEHAKTLLVEGVPISQTALDAGFADQSHFSRCFRQFTGATPRQYMESKPCDAWPAAQGL